MKRRVSYTCNQSNHMRTAKPAARRVTCGILLALVAAASADGRADGETAPDAVEFGLSATWDNRYVTEGRDNLDGDALIGAAAEATFKGLACGVWYGASPSADYRELNLGVTYTVAWKGVEAYASLTHLRFLSDDDHDTECGAGVSYAGLPAGLTAGIDGYHSFAADGAFFETFLGGDYAVCEWLTLAPAAVLGWNAGYIADGHDGANHFALSLEASTPLTGNVDLVLRLAYSWALDAEPERYPGDEGLKDFASVGVAVRAAF